LSVLQLSDNSIAVSSNNNNNNNNILYTTPVYFPKTNTISLIILLYPAANADFVPKISPVLLHASNAVPPKIKFHIPNPSGKLPSFIKVPF
jgi:hypothetical protein